MVVVKQTRNVKDYQFKRLGGLMMSPEEFKKFMLGELREHVERITQIAEQENPDLDSLEYHNEKATKVINILESVV